MVVVAHISDLHLDGSPERDARLRAVMATLAHMRGLDAIVVSGDISNDATTAGYRHARELLTADVPVLRCPGNVDDRDAFRLVLTNDTAPAGAPVNQRHDTAAATYLVCDSTVPPDETPGRLDDDTLAWLREQLDGIAAGRPIFVVMHHPPTSLDAGLAATMGLTNAAALADILMARPVSAVLVGHFHLPSTGTFAGVPMRMSGSVVADNPVPWEPERSGPVPSADPLVSFHMVDDAGNLQTAYRVVRVD